MTTLSTTAMMNLEETLAPFEDLRYLVLLAASVAGSGRWYDYERLKSYIRAAYACEPGRLSPYTYGRLLTLCEEVVGL